jgi:hypothetical protein
MRCGPTPAAPALRCRRVTRAFGRWEEISPGTRPVAVRSPHTTAVCNSSRRDCAFRKAVPLCDSRRDSRQRASQPLTPRTRPRRFRASVGPRWLVFYERHDPACDEPGRAHRLAGARSLDDLDDPTPRRDFDAPTRACGDDLIGPRPVVPSDNDLDTIALHGAKVPRRSCQSVALSRVVCTTPGHVELLSPRAISGARSDGRIAAYPPDSGFGCGAA